MSQPLRIVVVAADLDITDPDDDYGIRQADRSRSLRIGLLENGFNLVASLPPDVFLSERIAQLQPDLIIVDAESDVFVCGSACHRQLLKRKLPFSKHVVPSVRHHSTESYEAGCYTSANVVSVSIQRQT
jgi:AmiR/NasT family two-component response regulator